jgi:hypothetical protein
MSETKSSIFRGNTYKFVARGALVIPRLARDTMVNVTLNLQGKVGFLFAPTL